jgi:5'-deoxynucleotidase YfbR-like HD superfamily hydrolase
LSSYDFTNTRLEHPKTRTAAYDSVQISLKGSQVPKSALTDNVLELSSSLLVPAATTFRTIKLQPGLDRFENDAEHSFLLATLGCALGQRLDPKLDLGIISQFALVHDLVEVYAGDTSIWDTKERHASKMERETKALGTIEKRFGANFPWIAQTIAAYERLDEPESCFVYALDKIMPYVVMAAVDHQPFPPSRNVYEEKMAIAREKISRYPSLLDLFEGLDADYKSRPHFFDNAT